MVTTGNKEAFWYKFVVSLVHVESMKIKQVYKADMFARGANTGVGRGGPCPSWIFAQNTVNV